MARPSVFSSGASSVLACVARVNPRLGAAFYGLAAAQGLLLPAFTLATGALVAALEGGQSVVAPLALVAGLFVGQRVLDPVSEAMGLALARQVDERLVVRAMEAMGRPVGLAHVEDPQVLDKVAQAQGAITGITPGEAALRLNFVWRQRIASLVSLGIVAGFRWWAAPLLALVYLVGYRASRWHWHHVTLVLYGRTDALRRSYYLRSLALTAEAAKETRVFGVSSWLVGEYRTGWLNVMRGVWKSRREGWLVMATVVALLGAAEGVVLLQVAREVAVGTTSIGTAVVVVQALLAAGVLAVFQDGHWVIGEAARALARIAELEDAAAASVAELEGGHDPAGAPQHSIRFERVHFTYPGRDEAVFRGLDLNIERGKSLAIVGENGAGKTTFVKLLGRLYDPTQGQILVDGVPLRDIDPALWRRRLATVFQDFVQFEVSAHDNVAFGALPASGSRSSVTDAARRAGASPVIDRLPDGWETVLSREYEGGTQLSGGEWQRLALARAIYAVDAGAGVLILDEPTAAMDVRGEAEVYDRFLELTRGLTTIVISHRFSTVRRADRIVVIEHGEVVEDGSHHELMASGGRYATMYTLQAARFEEPVDG